MNAVLYYLAYPIIFLISIFPFPLFYAFSDLLAWFLYRIVSYKKTIVEKNIRMAFPEKSKKEIDHIKREFYTHFSDIMLEMIKSKNLSKKAMLKRFQVKNISLLTRFEENNQSCFLLCGHYASWEWMMSLGYHVRHTGYGIYTPLTNPYFDVLVQRIRKKHNAFMISRYSVREVLKKHQETGHLAIYGFASDQSPRPTQKTYWRTFLGVKVPVFTGAERLAKEYDIPLVFGAVKRIKRGYYELEFKLLSENPSEEKKYAITDQFTTFLEHQIIENPSHYFWTHNRFKFASMD